MNILILILITVAAYFYGCFSTARMLTKTLRSLNIYKVGTGLADTENIYTHVSRPMGVLVGALDIMKALLFLLVVELLTRLLANHSSLADADLLYQKNLKLLYRLAMLEGHCMPVSHKFKGGRGIFTYTGFLLYFVPWPMLISLFVAWLIVLLWRQIRFAQYVIVILPLLLSHVFFAFFPEFKEDLPDYFVAIIWGIAILMGVLNFVVSKKLGEL